MFHSRLCSIVIDCPAELMDQSVTFWTQALGAQVRGEPAADAKYITLDVEMDRMLVLLQRVPNGKPEVHLDIETDDVAAEVARLEELGAEKKYKPKSWWVMRAPSGHSFCVTEPEHADFPSGANPWPNNQPNP